jgi:hypothetical protein
MNIKSLFLFLLALIGFVQFVQNAFYVWSWGDDYLIKALLQKTSIISFLVNDYLTFDGRSLSIGYFISRFGLSTHMTAFATIVASALFFVCATILSLILQNKTKLKPAEFFINSVFFTAVLWLGCFNSLHQTLYWQTGMLYVVEVFLFYGVYYILNCTKIHSIWLFFLSIIAGMASPGAVLAILMVLVIEYFSKKESINRKRQLGSVLGFSIGLLIVMASPGNFNRLQMEGGLDQKAFSDIHEMYFRLNQFFNQFLFLNTPMLWVMMVFGVALTMVNNRNKATRGENNFLNGLYNYRWLIAAFITLAFYLPRVLYYLSSPRLNIHFVFFMCLFFTLHLAEFRTAFSKDFSKYFQIILLPVLCIFAVIGFYQLRGSKHCYGKMAKRIELYKANKNKDLVLKSNDLIGPPGTKEFTDIVYDTADALNKGVANYYELHSIRKEEYR